MGKKLGIREFFVNEGPMYTAVAVWLAVNVFLFAYTFNIYKGPQYTFLRAIVHNGLPTARGAAAVINLNCALLLLPVCRNCVDYVRGVFQCRRSIRRLFDKNILFHKTAAYFMCLATAVHIIAHIYNVEKLVDDGTYPKINPSDTPEHVLYAIWPGWTGVLIVVPQILIVTTASEQIRRSYFELFWYTHHLFVVFYAGLIMHGVTGFVIRQTNYDEVPFFDNGLTKNPNGRCDARDGFNLCAKIDAGTCASDYPNLNDNGATTCCPCMPVPTPLFADGSATSWKYVIGPLIVYLLERLYRFVMSQRRPLAILKVIKLPDSSPVMELQFQKVHTEAGQYVFINCPAVSQLEWHPITLTSCPELDYCSVHIRIVGDWTSKLAERCGFFNDEPMPAHQLPHIAIDGPFGTSSEDFFRFKVGVMVGAGIGVTPFVSLLKSIFFRKCTLKQDVGMDRVYFYWLCPGFEAWSWFASLLMDMEEKLEELGEPDFLNIRIFMTRGWTRDDAAKIILHDDEQGDTVVRDGSGRALRHKMNFGRPMWDSEFRQMEQVHKGVDVGVFLCGPKALSTELHQACNDHTDATNRGGTRFFYNKENF